MTPKQIAAFAIGPVGGALLSLVSLPLITWFFSQQDVGRMAMFQVTLSFSTLLFSLGLDQAYVREFHDTKNTPALLKQAALPGLALLIITLAVLIMFGGVLSDWLFGVPKLHLSVLVLIALLANFISRFFSLVLRMNERGLAYSMSQVLPKLLLLLIVGGYVLVDASKDLTNLILANTSAITFVFAIYAWNTRKEWLASFYCKLDISQLKQMLRFGLPLILGGLAFWGLTAMDKLFLRAMTSFEELGVYSVSVSFAAAAVILQSVFSTVWAPTVYKWASKGQGLENVHLVTRYILALVVLGFSLAGLFSWVVTLFLPSNYSAVQWIVVSCIGYPLLYTLSETTVVGIGISKRTSYSMLASLIAFAVNLAGNWVLIPIYGAAGAAVSTCLSFWVFFLVRTEFAIYLWKPVPRLLVYLYTIVVVAGAVIFTLWGKELGLWMVGFWLSVLASWLVVFRTEISKVSTFVFKRQLVREV
ncbi:polysaccharide biosynthesis protein [Idiomarina sp. WRN-38]|uniref:lipopolysaccharide biosynthesis protein n=1 Tax=Idiomarina sp. OXR-189 TaxID=3100175 RepID=UPI000733782F|nr:oligosaccharide flippase family protein [Idiomarina sp. OXR-189]KTG29873.1 polysaccharide biosynthesis protein [Idiomarina sp. H105]OAF13264.1 polysaccharide biosynthesis protein [Idiomarina sp. WRN-38]WPZ00830.1 oligosaccharide flippase family protein [Idiomarina sp. OXR-189]